MYVDIHVKQPLFFSDFNETLFFQHIFKKSTNIKLHEKPSSWNGVVPCRRTDERTDTTKIIIFFRILRKRLKIVLLI